LSPYTTLFRSQARLSAGKGEFTGANELLVVVCSPGQNAQNELGGYDGLEKRLEVAVEGGKEHVAAGLDERCASAYRRGWIRNVFEHFHARDDVETGGLSFCQCFYCDALVVNLDPRLQAVQASYGKRLLG